MTPAIQPFHLLVIALAGWLNRRQQAVIDYHISASRRSGPMPGRDRVAPAVYEQLKEWFHKPT